MPEKANGMDGPKKQTRSVLTRIEARTVEAMAERIFPTTDTPGAKEAGALSYLENALLGAYRSCLTTYRRGLRDLNRHTRQAFGRPFPDLNASEQDSVLADLESDRVPTVRNGAEFFELVRRHVLEGVFGDPEYGGNRDLVGWHLVGFPGQQFGYRDAYINRVVDLPPVAETGWKKGKE
jgi:gluconate 2-dehydrogenase gamma chain